MARPALIDTAFHVETRAEAIEALANGATSAIHDHAANPLIYRAASELIMRDDRGQKTDIRAMGLPHKVLAEVADELRSLGISMFASSQILEALEGYAVGLGADFAREAQAKPLYARVIVTDKKPDDMPDCELVQATLIDGQRRVGDGVSQRVMQSTIYGTRTSMTREMNLDEMLASSKKKWLLIYYGSPSGETYKGLDSVDVSLINLMQGLGGKIPQEIYDEIQTAIEEGNLTPAQHQIIEGFAKIESALEAFSAGDNIPPEIRIELSQLVSDLARRMNTVNDFPIPMMDVLAMVAQDFDIPMVQPIAMDMAANDENFNTPDIEDIISELQKIVTNEAIPLETREVIAKALNAENKGTPEYLDNLTAVLVTVAASDGISLPLFQSISTVLPMIATAKTADKISPKKNETDIQSVIELMQAISEGIKQEKAAGRDLPANLVEVVESISIIETAMEGKSPEEAIKLFAEALKSNEQQPFAIEVQKLVLSMAQPQVQVDLQSLPLPFVRDNITSFSFQNTEIIQQVATSMMIRDVESRLSGTGPVTHQNNFAQIPAMEPAELKQILQILKTEGVSGLIIPDKQTAISPAIRTVIEHLENKNPSLMETIVTASVIRDIQTQLDTGAKTLKLEPAELKQVLQILKQEGAAALAKPETLARMPPMMAEAVATMAITREIEARIQGIPTQTGFTTALKAEPAELKKILEVIKSGGIATLLQPEHQVNMTPSVKQMVNQLAEKNPSMMEVAATTTMIRNIETQLNGGAKTLKMEPAELKQVLQILKQEGAASLVKPETLARMSPVMAEAVTTMAITRAIEARIQGIPTQTGFATALKAEPAELKKILEVIKSGGIATLLQPEHQANMTPSVKQVVNQLAEKNPSMMEVAATTTMIRNIETQLNGGAKMLKMEPAELKQVLQILKQEGAAGLVKPQTMARMSPSMAEAVTTMAITREIEARIQGIPTQTGFTTSLKAEPAELKKVLDSIKTNGISVILQPELRAQMSPSAQKTINEFVRQNPELIKAATLSVSSNAAPHQIPSRRIDQPKTADVVAVLSKVIAEPRSGKNFHDYNQSLGTLRTISEVMSQSGNMPPLQKIINFVNTPHAEENVRRIAQVIDNISPSQWADMSAAEQKTVLQVKTVFAANEIQNNEIIAQTVSNKAMAELQTALASGDPHSIEQALASVEGELDRAGIPAPDSIDDLKETIQEFSHVAETPAPEIPHESPPIHKNFNTEVTAEPTVTVNLAPPPPPPAEEPKIIIETGYRVRKESLPPKPTHPCGGGAHCQCFNQKANGEAPKEVVKPADPKNNISFELS